MLRAAALLLAFAAPATSFACSQVALPKSAYAPLPAQRADARLLDSAVLAEVNLQRCRHGLRPLTSAAGQLSLVTKDHSNWMAQKGVLSHKSNVRGRRTLSDRVKAANLRNRRASENIAVLSRYQFGAQRFRILNARSCQFASASGQMIQPHSYASLARLVVTLWMQSPGHRRNILDRGVSRVTTSASFSNDQNCGQFWVTQNFVG